MRRTRNIGVTGPGAAVGGGWGAREVQVLWWRVTEARWRDEVAISCGGDERVGGGVFRREKLWAIFDSTGYVSLSYPRPDPHRH